MLEQDAHGTNYNQQQSLHPPPDAICHFTLSFKKVKGLKQWTAQQQTAGQITLNKLHFTETILAQWITIGKIFQALSKHQKENVFKKKTAFIQM